MSCNEWEAGTITLPTAEVKRVREAVRTVAEARANRLYDEAQAFWKALPAKARRNREAYQKATSALWDLGDREGLIDLLWYGSGYGGTGPRRILKADLVRAFGKITGANPTFELGEARISFRGRKVTWDVPENNHACDTAHDHPVAKAFFDVLRTVKWTRGSGGVITGNNEYSRDDRSAGGGGNYVVYDFGPPTKNRPLRHYNY